MNGSGGNKSSSSLVVVEKRCRKPGGCTGIFFQLFEWNRKFAKKLLFSRRVLPPARAKQANKKFGGHEKLAMTKLLLIADENRGGFPCAKKNGFRGVGDDDEKRLRKHEMQSPSLVARLMGLESMPVVQQETPKSQTHYGKDEKFVGELKMLNKEVCSFEKECRKMESRPQKIQKTGLCERGAMTRFGVDALQLKGVFSCPKKHRAKLVSPMKSPRSVSGRGASRLIDAATKILEPGLRATNRKKYGLSYSNCMRQTPNNEEITGEDKPIRSTELSNHFGYYESEAKSLKEQSSCKSHRNPLDFMELSHNTREDQSSSCCSPSQGSGSGNCEAPMLYFEQEMNVVFQKSGGKPIALDAQPKDGQQKHGEQITYRKPHSPKGQMECPLATKNCKPHQDISSSSASKYSTQNQMTVVSRDNRTPARLSNLPRRRVSSAVNSYNVPKDSVAVNRSSSAQAGPSMLSKVESCKLETSRKSCNKQDSSFLQLSEGVRKRTANPGRHVVNTSLTSSISGNQRDGRFELMNGEELGQNATSVNQSYLKSRLAHQRDSRISTVKSTDAVSFTSSYTKRHAIGVISEEMDKTQWNRSHAFSTNNSEQKRVILDEDGRSTRLLKPMPPRGDALGAFLEQKFIELSHEEEDEFAAGQPKRFTTMILQELISVLNREMPISLGDAMVDIDRKDDSRCGIQEYSNHAFLHNGGVFQAEANMKHNRFPDNGSHFSPGSVLEASFSNDSCFSSSLDDSSGVRLHHPDPKNYSTNHPQPLKPDSDLLDSATSLDKSATFTQMVTHLISQIPAILHRIGARLTGNKLNYAKEVILTAELMFGNAEALQKSHGTKDFVFGPLLLVKLETLVLATSAGFFLSFDKTKEVNQFRAFLLDCVIEYLETKNVTFYKLWYVAQRGLLLSLGLEMLIYEVSKEIRRWTHLEGKLIDEIIDDDMSHSLGKWTDFEIEALEIGADIGRNILHDLVDEIMVDLR